MPRRSVAMAGQTPMKMAIALSAIASARAAKFRRAYLPPLRLLSPPPQGMASRASSCFSLLGASNERTITWGWHIDPSRRAGRNDLDRNSNGDDAALITNQVYVSAADIGEALA
jgi:hypothetical protein